jgi:hypothetical protein
LLITDLPCIQEVPPTEPVEEGDEGEWDTVGEPAGSRSPSPTVEELIAQLEHQPPALQGGHRTRSPRRRRGGGRRRALHRLPLLQRRQRLQRRRRRSPQRVD